MRIAVYGFAKAENQYVKERSRQVGRYIAERKHMLATGTDIGIPQDAVLGCREARGECIGFSPAIDIASHRRYGLPTEGISQFVFIPREYDHSDNLDICLKYRNVTMANFSDAGIIIGGDIDTMHSFTTLHDLDKVIGILDDTGGITTESIGLLLEMEPERKRIIRDSDPQKLVDAVIAALSNRQ